MFGINFVTISATFVRQKINFSARLGRYPFEASFPFFPPFCFLPFFFFIRGAQGGFPSVFVGPDRGPALERPEAFTNRPEGGAWRPARVRLSALGSEPCRLRVSATCSMPMQLKHITFYPCRKAELPRSVQEFDSLQRQSRRCLPGDCC